MVRGGIRSSSTKFRLTKTCEFLKEYEWKTQEGSSDTPCPTRHMARLDTAHGTWYTYLKLIAHPRYFRLEYLDAIGLIPFFRGKR